MATQTDKLAPRILINEHDIENAKNRTFKHPITLIFGFSPLGRTCEMVMCNNATEIMEEFGFPTTAAEKYFIDAGINVVQNGATALMTRLPYDNEQAHMVKYVTYKLEEPIAMKDIATTPAETKMRGTDDKGVTILKEMNSLDSRMTQFQRISQVSDDYGTHIKYMDNDKLVETELDPKSNLDDNTFIIADIRCEQYGVGAAKKEYTGIFPIITSAPMAMYYQGRIKNTESLDACLSLLDVSEGIEMSTEWWKQADPMDDETKMA